MATDLLQECTKFKGKVELNSILQYSRGSGVQEIEHDDISVLHKVFTRMNLNCRSPIEIPDYDTNHEPLCFHCASINILSEDSPEFQDKYLQAMFFRQKATHFKEEVYHSLNNAKRKNINYISYTLSLVF